MEVNKKVVIGVSGGPDSIYLLTKLIEDKKDIIVVHVNYHLRDESDFDEKLVVDYCKKNNLEYIVKQVNEKDWEKYHYLKNKQSMAREIRYDLYIEIAKEFQCKDIYIAHHKDDFIETAIMQENRSGDYLFYGLKDENNYKGYIIKRPLLFLYKKDIMQWLDAHDIKYVMDKTNAMPIYDRNVIRLNMLDKTIKQKNNIYNHFDEINKRKEDLRIDVSRAINEFKNSDNDWGVYSLFNKEIQKHLIYDFLINSNYRISINKDKIDGILEFLKNKRGNKEYRLMKNIFFIVNKGKIKILHKEE